jgi:hypothetical protein
MRIDTIKIVSIILIIGIVGLFTSLSYSAIDDFKSIKIDFRNALDAADKASWSDPDVIKITNDGLGWDGHNEVKEGWIRTKPIALGLSWRPATVATIRVTIKPAPKEITLDNGQKMTPYLGDVYARYSPDMVHWSTWQILQHNDPQPADGRYFHAAIQVPDQERAEYGRYITQYSMLDVPWKSDEEAMVRWVLAQQPDFFVKHLPIIGYIEFLYENNFDSGQRITSFNADIIYMLPGLHSAPKDQNVYKDRESIPWRFDARDKNKK